MFDMLASKIGEAQAFADGLVNLDALSMDRLLEEQEREERAKDESLRLLRASGDATDVACFHDADFGETESSRSADIELQQLSADSEQFRSIGGGGGGGDGANFEDEFDPILASIRKPAHDPGRASPIRVSSASPTRTGRPASTASASSPRDGFESFLPGERDDRDPYTSVTDGYRGNPPAAGGTFASGLLSMFPGNMRARAEDVMAQSSASISKSAGAFRSALESSGGSSAAAAAKGKRRESDPPYLMDAASRSEEGRGKNGAGGGGRRMMAGDGDEEDVPMVSVNDLLSDDERQQLASFSGGGGRGRGVCAWRRRPKYLLVGAAVGVALVGVYCLWLWTAVMLGVEEDGVAALGAGRR